MSTSPANDRCHVCQRPGVHLLIGGRCAPCRVQAGQAGVARAELPADLPALLRVPPDAPALAFTKAGGPEGPAYTIELLVVGRGHPTDSRPLGDPLGPEERGYVWVWVDSPRDGAQEGTQLVAHAFRARVYLDAPPIWLEHLGPVGGDEERGVHGAFPLAAEAANEAFARAWRGLQLLHETARLGRPPGTGRWRSREDFLESVGGIARQLYRQYRRRPTIDTVRQYLTPHDDDAEEPVAKQQIIRWYKHDFGWKSWDAFLQEALRDLG